MSTQMNALYDPKRRKKKIRKWLRTILIIVFALLAGFVGQAVIDNTIGRSDNIYDVIGVYGSKKKGGINEIIYGDSSALVLYRDRFNGSISQEYYYKKNGLWSQSRSFLEQLFSCESVSFGVYKIYESNDYYISVEFNPGEYTESEKEISDQANSTFYQCTENIYYAAIHPTSENYHININGETFTIELWDYDIYSAYAKTTILLFLCVRLVVISLFCTP